jgi:uncharacterized membrane protein (UPF0127 family)
MSQPQTYEFRLAPTAPPTFKVEVARSSLARARGLMGRDGLEPGKGLYLPGTNSIHMLFMRFPIDCVFVGAPLPDGSRHVVGLSENLKPWTGVVWWARGAKGAVEVPAGAARAAGIEVGQPIWLAS